MVLIYSLAAQPLIQTIDLLMLPVSVFVEGGKVGVKILQSFSDTGVLAIIISSFVLIRRRLICKSTCVH